MAVIEFVTYVTLSDSV